MKICSRCIWWWTIIILKLIMIEKKKELQMRWRKIFKHTVWILFKGTKEEEVEIVGVGKRVVCWCEWLWWSNLNWKKNIDILNLIIRWVALYNEEVDYQTQNISGHFFAIESDSRTCYDDNTFDQYKQEVLLNCKPSLNEECMLTLHICKFQLRLYLVFLLVMS